MRSGREATPTAQHDAKRAPSRRRFVQGAGLFALGASPLAALAAGRDTGEGVTFADGPRPMVTYPQKRPLIRVHTRPPHLETPFSVFNEGPITANDAFFVRYHLANIPLAVDPATYRLTVKGKVNTPLNLSLAELKALAEPVEVVAVNQCSGNSRCTAAVQDRQATDGRGSGRDGRGPSACRITGEGLSPARSGSPASPSCCPSKGRFALIPARRVASKPQEGVCQRRVKPCQLKWRSIQMLLRQEFRHQVRDLEVVEV